jgi:hypothetical protein
MTAAPWKHGLAEDLESDLPCNPDCHSPMKISLLPSNFCRYPGLDGSACEVFCEN